MISKTTTDMTPPPHKQRIAPTFCFPLLTESLIDPANYHDSEVPDEAKTLAHVSEQNFTTIFYLEMIRGIVPSMSA